VFGHVAMLFKQSRAWEPLGFASFGHYCEEGLGMAERTVAQRIALERSLYRIPLLRRALREKRISYEKSAHHRAACKRRGGPGLDREGGGDDLCCAASCPPGQGRGADVRAALDGLVWEFGLRRSYAAGEDPKVDCSSASRLTELGALTSRGGALSSTLASSG